MIFSPLEKINPSVGLPSRRPLATMSFFMLIILGLTLARLFELTIIRGKENRVRADENRILVRPIHASRGVILDRGGIPLTRNVPAVREIDFPGDDLGPVPIEEAARSYPFGPALAHAVGYVGEVSPEELENCLSPSNPSLPADQRSTSRERIVREAGEWQAKAGDPSCPLSPGDIIGKSGLEKQYDSLLRGTDGAELIEVDANGKTLRTISTQAPISGQNLAVNLDANLSVAALSVLSGKKGSVVALDPKDGSVLALVSSPSFDPNLFQKTLKTQSTGESDIRPSDSLTFRLSGSPSIPSVLDILNDKVNFPLFNRPVSGEYPPGSIFKLVTASAGLSEGKINSSTLIEDTGEIRVGDFRYGNWYFDQYGRTEGAINIVRAIARSNDIFFYRVGEWLGPQALADWAKKLGLGQKTGVDLPSEADGLIPDPQWKERQIGEKWYLGNTYHMAIGQGDVRVTPLQVAEMTASVVTGQKCRPHIRREGSDLSAVRKDRSDPSCQDTAVSDENRNLILSGMLGGCSSGGTAFPFFNFSPAVGCKTGTAQHGGAKTLPHAWIAVAGPIVSISPDIPDTPYLDLESPKRIVLVVLVEESGEGSYVAAPLAKQILTAWFNPE